MFFFLLLWIRYVIYRITCRLIRNKLIIKVLECNDFAQVYDERTFQRDYNFLIEFVKSNVPLETIFSVIYGIELEHFKSSGFTPVA